MPGAEAAPQEQELLRGEERRRILNRIKRAEGQLRGLRRMIEAERPCGEVLTLLIGVRRALDAAGEKVLSDYLEGCQQQGAIDPAEVNRIVRLLRS